MRQSLFFIKFFPAEDCAPNCSGLDRLSPNEWGGAGRLGPASVRCSCTAVQRPQNGLRPQAAGEAMLWSMAPKMLVPSLPLISMRMVSPNFMNSVLGLPSWMVSMQRFSAMQL